jgi:hypothetical protein
MYLDITELKEIKKVVVTGVAPSGREPSLRACVCLRWAPLPWVAWGLGPSEAGPWRVVEVRSTVAVVAAAGTRLWKLPNLLQ